MTGEIWSPLPAFTVMWDHRKKKHILIFVPIIGIFEEKNNELWIGILQYQ
jgi:hypothetical protein